MRCRTIPRSIRRKSASNRSIRVGGAGVPEARPPRSTSISGRARASTARPRASSSRWSRWLLHCGVASRAGPRCAGCRRCAAGRGGAGAKDAGHGSLTPTPITPYHAPTTSATSTACRSSRAVAAPHLPAMPRIEEVPVGDLLRKAGVGAAHLAGPTVGQGRLVPGLPSAALRGRRAGPGRARRPALRAARARQIQGPGRAAQSRARAGGGAEPGLRARRHRLPAAP